MAEENDLAGRRELREILSESEVALFTTRGEDGHYHSRPMALRRSPFHDAIWLATGKESAKVAELAAHRECCITTFKNSTYLSISGRAEIVLDRDTLTTMWDEAWSPWFSGPADPNLALLRVEPEHAEYVRPRTKTFQVLFSKAKSILTRAPPEASTSKRTLELEATAPH